MLAPLRHNETLLHCVAMGINKILQSGGPCILGKGARQGMARMMREDADLPPFAPPRLYGLRLGFRLRVRSEWAYEPTTEDVLVYPWAFDDRSLGEWQHLALAQGWLLRRQVLHTEHDVALLALDIAIPPEEHGRGLAHIIWRQRWLPIAVIRAAYESPRLRA